MKIEIKNRWSGNIIFSIETDTWKLAVEAAIKANADLRYADLRSADLRSADLRSANLRSADLSSADLRSANLRSANLRSADLSSADLRFADLSFANLSSAEGVNKHQCTPLTILQDQIGKIRAYKIVNDRYEGIYNGGIKYEVGKTVEAETLNTDDTEQCGAGINLATLAWCLQEWCSDRHILLCEFTLKDTLIIPVATDGKFRVKRCKVIKEINYKKYGIKK